MPRTDGADSCRHGRRYQVYPIRLPGEDRNVGSGLFVDLIRRRAGLPTSGSRSSSSGEQGIATRCAGLRPSRPAVCGWRRTSAGPTTTRRVCRPCAGSFCLCTRCHRTTHFGYAEVTGQTAQAHAHLRTVNRWNVITADDHIAAAVRTWQHRSAVDWSLDLSLPTAAGVVPSPAPTAPTRRRVASDTLDRTTRDKR